MKRFIIFALTLNMIVCAAITAFSYDIDGTNDGVEWENAESVLLFSGEESNSNVEFGSAMWSVDGNSLYLCFKFIEPGITLDSSNIAVSFSVDNSDFFTVTAGESFFSDSEMYRVEGSASVDTTSGTTCEARVGFKHGITDNIICKVRFIDSQGSYSNIYSFDIYVHADDYYDNSYVDDYAETTKSPAATTTNPSTIKSPESTKTTDKNSDVGLGLLDFLFSEETTKDEKAQNTTKKSTNKITRKSTKTTKKSNVKSKKKSDTEHTNETISVTEETAAISYSGQAATQNRSSISTADGKKYQMLTAAACGIALITVVILGSAGANKKAEKGLNKTKEQPEDNHDNDSSAN